MPDQEINKTAQRCCAVILLAAVLLVYGQVVAFRYSGTTDFREVASNRMVAHGLTAASVQWVTDGSPGRRWQPLTWLLHQAVASVDNQPTLHHAINLLLHLVNVLLLFMVLERVKFAPIPNMLIAGVFGLHPMRAESVAWVSAVGDILGTTFLLMALFSVTEHLRDSKGGGLGAAILFAVGAILSSPRYALAPLLLPLFATAVSRSLDEDGDEVSRARWPIWIPFIPVAAFGFAKTGVVAQLLNGQWGTLVSESVATVGGAANLVFQFLWPFGLTLFYADRSLLLCVSAGVVLVGGAVTAAIAVRSRTPTLSFGLATFLFALPPLVSRTAIDSFQIPIAESYLAVTGITMVVFGLTVVAQPGRRFSARVRWAGGALVIGLGFVAAMQSSHRADSFALLRHNIAVCSTCDEPYRMLGDLYASRNDQARAADFYRRAVDLNPDDPTHHMALALAYWNQMDRTSARRELTLLVAQHPDYQPGVRALEALNR